MKLLCAPTYDHLSFTGLIFIISLSLISIYPTHSVHHTMPEICDNAIDDDGDGMIDLNDVDCECTLLEPISLIPNPSFEDQNCCPVDRGQLNCADGWIQASEPTTDYISTCGWMGWDDFEVPLPFPDGNAVVGFRDGRFNMSDQNPGWKEYAGSALLSPLLKDTKYRFEFSVGFVDRRKSPDIAITFFGTSDKNNLPFGVGDEMLGCPTNGPGWTRLGAKGVSGQGGNRWVKTTIDVTPTEDIHAIAIGPSCRPFSDTVSTYYFFDNLVLADLRSFEFVISTLDHPCSNTFTLMVPEEAGLQYQWYKDGIALLGEIQYELTKSYGAGIYQVRVIGQNQCLITKSYDYKIPVIQTTEKITICNNEIFQLGNVQLESSGNYEETLTSVDGCDSVVQLELVVLPELKSSVDAFVFEGEDYVIGSWSFKSDDIHNAVLSNVIGCDSIVTVNLSYFNLYQPNIFSPNDDNANDFFIIKGDEHLVEINSLVIYDRWGGELYNESDLISNNSSGWNGQSKNKNAMPGSYTYFARVLMDDQKERIRTGTVLLIR